MADDDIRDSATDSDDEAVLDLSLGTEHSAFLDDEELHEQLVDDGENDERTALTAAHQGSSGTSTPSSEAAAFVLPTDEAFPDSAEDRAGSRNSSNGAAAGSDQPGTGADSLVGLGTDQPGENASNTQGERATPNRTAGAASDPAASQVAARGNGGGDNQAVENAEGDNNAAQADNPSDSAAALGTDPLAQAVTPGAGQGNQADTQAGEGAGGTAEQDAPDGTQPPPEEDETAEVVVEEAAPPPPPTPPVVPDPNAGPSTADAAASGAEDAASISVTISGSDTDGTVDSFALSSLPSDG
ncbi:MAG: hypothetical protein HKN28_10100, partial [Alphaproteobacteria bacterium]|nr:hypothetical protein [Alphaproteobacteria bacterium]